MTSPDVLYRYLRIDERLDDLLITRQLYFASPFTQNDIFECHYELDFNRPTEEIMKFLTGFMANEALRSQIIAIFRNQNDAEALAAFAKSPEAAASVLLTRGFHTTDSFKKDIAQTLRRMLEQKVGICCFSEIGNDPLMFAHYADSHRGCCLGFKTAGDFIGLSRPVKYSDHVPRISAY